MSDIPSKALTWSNAVVSLETMGGMLGVPNWTSVPLRDGGTVDLSQFPLAARTEELLRRLRAVGQASLFHRAKSYRARLLWNADHFPDVLVWFSNFGRKHAPWNVRPLAVGVEPVCVAFGLGRQISAAPYPINAFANPTVRSFHAGEVFVTSYRVTVEPT